MYFFHRFGNGRFACMILGLTLTDLITSLVGLIGEIVLEAEDWQWIGSRFGCLAYYSFISWLLGISGYLVVLIVSYNKIKSHTKIMVGVIGIWASSFKICLWLVATNSVTSLVGIMNFFWLDDNSIPDYPKYRGSCLFWFCR